MTDSDQDAPKALVRLYLRRMRTTRDRQYGARSKAVHGECCVRKMISRFKGASAVSTAPENWLTSILLRAD